MLVVSALLVLPVRAGAAAEPPAPAGRVAFVAGSLSPPELIMLTAAVAAGNHPGIVLLDSAKATRYLRTFLEAYHPERVLPVGNFPEGIHDAEQRLDIRMA